MKRLSIFLKFGNFKVWGRKGWGLEAGGGIASIQSFMKRPKGPLNLSEISGSHIHIYLSQKRTLGSTLVSFKDAC